MASYHITRPDLPSDDGTSITLSATFDQASLQIRSTPLGAVIALEGCILSGSVGGPGLPSCTMRVALPPQSSVTHIAVEARETVWLTNEPLFVAPLQPPIPALPDRSADLLSPPLAAAPFVPPSTQLYERVLSEPPPLAQLIHVEPTELATVATLEFHPVSFDSDQRLVFFLNIDVRISYESIDETHQENALHRPRSTRLYPRSTLRSWEQTERLVALMSASVVNPDDIPVPTHWRELFPPAQVDYLIVTSDEEWEATSIAPKSPAHTFGRLSSCFRRLAAWKARRGLRTRVVTIAEIVQGIDGACFTTCANGLPARNLQEVLRNFLKWAHQNWGVAWVLLGGDVNVIPAGAAYVTQTTPGDENGGRLILFDQAKPVDNEPLPLNHSRWTGSYLKIRTDDLPFIRPELPGLEHAAVLTSVDACEFIPYDPTGHAPIGWFFTDKSYEQPSGVPKAGPVFIRVNGPESMIKKDLRWHFGWHHVTTDLYYASLFGNTYDRPGKHDWDLVDNGLPGQVASLFDLDGLRFQTDVSVGRAPISSKTQAEAFVTKVIAYEQFYTTDSTELDLDWPRSMTFVASNWAYLPQLLFKETTSRPPDLPKDGTYQHYATVDPAWAGPTTAKPPFSLIHGASLASTSWRLYACSSDSPDPLPPQIPYDPKGEHWISWYFTVSGTDHTPSEQTTVVNGIPHTTAKPTEWIIVHGSAATLKPASYRLEPAIADTSMLEQEQFRKTLAAMYPVIDTVVRVYEDSVDLPDADKQNPPCYPLTRDNLHRVLNDGPHLVSLSGHGSPDGCCGLDADLAKSLDNRYHTFIAYAEACYTGAFDCEDATSEYLLYNPHGGAIAYIGHSGMSWIGYTHLFMHEFYKNLELTHLGLMHDTRCNLLRNEWIYKGGILDLNLLGDPEMPVWLGRPSALSATITQQTTPKKRVVRIEVTRDGQPAPHATICLALPAGKIVTTRAGADGAVTLTVPPGVSGVADAVISQIGTIPLCTRLQLGSLSS